MLIIGTRSLLLTAPRDLALLIVDEAHERMIDQEQWPYYSVSNLYQYSPFRIVYVTATPSLKIYRASKRNELQLVRVSEEINTSQ
jgi:primosomal protein N'